MYRWPCCWTCCVWADCGGPPNLTPGMAVWFAAWSIFVAGRELAAAVALGDEEPGVVVVTIIDLEE